MRITVDAPEWDDIRRKLNTRAPAVFRKALNETADTAAASIGREIAKVYNLKSTYVKENLKVTHATDENLNAEVKVKGQGRYKEPLYRFIKGAKKPWNPANKKLRRKIDYTFAIKKNQAPIQSKHFFVAKMESGHLGVFRKQDSAKARLNRKFPTEVRNRTTTLGIEEVYTLSIAEMARQEQISQAVEDAVSRRLKNRLNYFTREALRQMGGH